MRASVMMHLPALVLSGSMNKMTASLSQLGMTVRGIYGEAQRQWAISFRYPTN